MLDPAALRARLNGVRDRIARAAGRAGRDSASIRLVAISKTFTSAHIRVLADAGQIDFGENKVQEALDKMRDTSDLPLRWHLVGHLQSNKARKAAAHFSVIHSVDDLALVEKVDEAAGTAGRQIDLLVQVDLAGEATKHGVSPDQVMPILTASSPCRFATMTGLMTLPPASADPALVRPYFARLRTLRDELVSRGVAPMMLRDLSMGMSHDFEVAVEEGATLIRVGSAIFGERPPAGPAPVVNTGSGR